METESYITVKPGNETFLKAQVYIFTSFSSVSSCLVVIYKTRSLKPSTIQQTISAYRFMMNLEITQINGDSTSLTVDHNATVRDLKQVISQQFNVNPHQQRLSTNNGERIDLNDDSRSLSSYRLTSGSTVALLITNPGPMQVFVKNLPGESISYDVDADETVDQLQKKIYQREGVVPDQQRLLHENKELVRGKKLKDYNIKHLSTIFLTLRLRGGV